MAGCDGHERDKAIERLAGLAITDRRIVDPIVSAVPLAYIDAQIRHIGTRRESPGASLLGALAEDWAGYIAKARRAEQLRAASQERKAKQPTRDLIADLRLANEHSALSRFTAQEIRDALLREFMHWPAERQARWRELLAKHADPRDCDALRTRAYAVMFPAQSTPAPAVTTR